jgi:type IV pilus assembly protein PilW
MKPNPGKSMPNFRQRGFSLVEILVSITLSLVVLAGVLAVMYSSKVTYMENDRVARLQEAGRTAFDIMLRDLRGSGFPGCAQELADVIKINNLLDDQDQIPWNLAQPVYGFEGGASAWTPALDATLIPDATPGNDIFVLRTTLAGSPQMRVPTPVLRTDDIPVEKDASEALTPGSTALISDCTSSTIFVVGGFADAGTDATITLGTGGGPPSNTTDDLGANFKPGSRVQPIVSVAYYVAPSSSGTGSSLWRVTADQAPEELVPGVEAMQLRYGVNTDGDSDLMVSINEYLNADEITDWNEVVSVTMSILVRSAEENSQTEDTRTYQLLDDELGPFNDHYQRALFTTTVTLRNRTT